MSRNVFAAFALMLLVLCGGATAIAQSTTTGVLPAGLPKEIKLREPIKYGENCRRLNDGKAGIFKRDACGRTYCGRTDVKDIVEIRPNFAVEHACTWQLTEAQCKCLKASK